MRPNRVVATIGVLLAGAASLRAGSSAAPEGKQEFKLTWEAPCRFTYPDGTELPYHQAYCDYALAKDPAAQRHFSFYKLYKESSDDDNPTQKGFLAANAAEAKTALEAWEHKKTRLLQETTPTTAEAQPKAFERGRALIKLRNRVAKECPEIAAPFGGRAAYVKDCNTRLSELDKAIAKAEAKVPEEQKALLEKTHARVFLGQGTAANLKKTTGQLAGKGTASDAHKLGSLFENQRGSHSNGGPRQLGRSAALHGNTGMAAGGLRDDAARRGEAAFGAARAAPPPPLAAHGSPTGTYTLSGNVPRDANGKPELKPGYTYTAYYNEGITHSAAFVVLNDGRIARRDSEPAHKGQIIVYPDLESSLVPHKGEKEIPQLTFAGKNGQATLEYMKSGEPGAGALSVVTRKAGDAVRGFDALEKKYLPYVSAPVRWVNEHATLPVLDRVSHFSDWCASDAVGAVAAQEPNPLKRIAYSVAGTSPHLVQGTTNMLASND